MSLVGHRTIQLFGCYIYVVVSLILESTKIEIKSKILMSNIHKPIRFVISDDPLVQLILIEDDVIPMPIGAKRVLDQVIARCNYYLYSSFYKPTTNGVYP